MGSLSLDSLKRGFDGLLSDAQPTVLPDFLAWVDMKVAEYKLTGYIYPRKRQNNEFRSKETSSRVSDHLKRNTPTIEVESPKPSVTKETVSAMTLISRDESKLLSNIQSSQSSRPLNLSPAQNNGALAKLLDSNPPSPLHSSSRLALKVPSLPASPYSRSPVSYQSSPPPGTIVVKPDSYSALRSLLQGSARVNLTSEFQEKNLPENGVISEEEQVDVKGKHFECQECGKAFLHRSSFKRHMKIHQGVFSNHCHTCERKFTRKEHFIRHKCFSVRPDDYSGQVEDWGNLANSPVKLEATWQNVMSSPADRPRYTDKTSEATIDTDSESSGQGSPNYYGESRRKKAAPRKVVPDVESRNESYFSDIDESIYDSVAIKTESGALDFSMKSKKKREQQPLNENESIDLSMKTMKVLREKQESLVTKESSLKPGMPVDNVYPTLYDSPPAGFRIGDLIENAVAKYHSVEAVKFMSPSKVEQRAEFLANNRPELLTPPRTGTFITGDEHDVAVAGTKAVDPNDPKDAESNFLSTNTGTYQITTEDVDSDSPLLGDEGTPNKVIKVVKQGNYLKLKKEAQLIDGELRFICPHCNKVFHRSSNFSRHMRIHRGVFSYICSACNRGFYRKEHFDKHKCYRKAMATTWDRKTRVDMDQEDGDESEMDGGRDKENVDSTGDAAVSSPGSEPDGGECAGRRGSSEDAHNDSAYTHYESDDEEQRLVIDE